MIGAAVAALLSTVLVQVSVASVAAPQTDAPELSESQKALAEAKTSGERVEVTGQRSERTTVYANPDGFSFTLKESAVPVRVSKPGGGWQAPDPTLERRTDGSVAPKAAVSPIVFSGGGDNDPLARIAHEGRSLELSWPGALPEPKLEGASAVYANVLPDVDLKVTATIESFQHVLVVKTPEAAANEKLKQIDLGLKTAGVEVVEEASGSLAAVDADGNTVFEAPPARMWNSAGQALATPARLTTTDETAPSDPAETAPADSGSGDRPGQGDVVAQMDVKVGKETLTIVPDAELLGEQDSSVFPLFIDPSIGLSEGAKPEWTLLRSDGYKDYAWGNGSDGQGEGAGECGTWNGYLCSTKNYVQRLYFEFSPAALKGKHVLDATFRVTMPWAFQCDPRWVDLVRTKQNISSSTTWATRPQGDWDTMGDRHVSAGRGDLCDPGLPDAALEFNDNPDETNENLTPTIRDFAAGKFSRLTLMIKAHDETDTSAWKRFKNNAEIEVKYVGVPATPTEVGFVTGTGYVCSTNSSSPSIVSSPTPAVQGRPRTAAGGEKSALLRNRWRTDKWDGTQWVTAHTDIDRPTTGYVGNLAKTTANLPTLQEGVAYRLKALTLSYYEGGTNRLNSGYSTPCYFKIDKGAPKPPKITLSSPYTPCVEASCAPAGGPGQKVTFTFSPNAVDTDVIGYEYKLPGQTAWTRKDGKSVSVDFTPPTARTYTVEVRALDTLRPGEDNTVSFLVKAGDGPVVRYHFAEASGVAVDAATADGTDDAVLSSGASRDNRGRRGLMTHDAAGQPLSAPVDDTGLVLDGATGYAATSEPALETRSSYTMAAWVRLTPGEGVGVETVLSQSTNTSPFAKKSSPFYLSYHNGTTNAWSLRAQGGDGTWHQIRSKQSSPRGVWTHVAGVHDAADKKIRLYVNGVFQGETDAGTPYAADGSLQVGRVLYEDVYTDYVNGVIDEAAVWQRALTETELQDEARLLISDKFAGTELIADWNPTRGVTGTTIKDTTSAYGKTLTLTDGASIADEAIVLDGVDDAATAPGPIVDGSGSFTATTQVELDPAKLLAKDVGYIGQVTGQRTADGSAWGLWFELTGKKTVLDEETLEEVTVPEGMWHFGRRETDGTFSSVTSEQTASVDSAVRLTGVHDSVDGTISLYIGYGLNGEPKTYTAQIGSGEFTAGKAYAAGAWKHFLPAHITDIRLWAGAMASSEQVETTVGD